MSFWKQLKQYCTGQSLVLSMCTVMVLVTRDVTAHSPILYDTGEIKEYCQLEKFEASCPENEVVVISSGVYGRMRLGRCMRKAYDSLGCSIDVVTQMDRLCSGRQSCSFDVSTLHGHRHPCPTDLTPFLEGGYYCQPIIPGVAEGCAASPRAMVLKQTSGYISNHVTVETGRGSVECPWRIQVPEGQKINITLVNFARVTLSSLDDEKTATAAGKPNICYQFAQIREKEIRPITECEGGNRLIHAYLSTTSSVDVAIITKRDMDVHFMLYYEAVGCPNPVLSPSLWVKRSGDTATVKCNSTGDSWEIKCVGHEWQGDVGNCTITSTSESPIFGGDGFPYSILIVVAIGVALGVFLGGILLVCASKYFKRRREGQLRNDTFQPSFYGVEHGKVLASQFDDVGGGSPRTLHYHGVHIEDPTLPPGDKQCKCTFSSYGPPPGYHPASQISSHMYESPQFDRKDSR